MGAPSIDLAPELNALPERLRYATLFALGKAIASWPDQFPLEYFQKRNPKLFATVLPRAIVAGLRVLGQLEAREQILAQVRKDAEAFRLKPDETTLLTRLLLHAFAEPKALMAILSNENDESNWLSDADLEALGAKPPIGNT